MSRFSCLVLVVAVALAAQIGIRTSSVVAQDKNAEDRKAIEAKKLEAMKKREEARQNKPATKPAIPVAPLDSDDDPLLRKSMKEDDKGEVTTTPKTDAPAAEAPTTEKPSPEVQSKVTKLVRQLEADQLSQRDKAEASLIELGPEILSILPVGEGAAVRQSLDRVRNKLEQVAVQRASQPATITLSGEKSLLDIISEFKKQTGNELVLQPDLGPLAKKKLKVNFKQSKFWDALDQTLDLIPATTYPYQSSNGLSITARPKLEKPRVDTAVYSGPLRVEVSNIQIEQSTRTIAPPQMRVGLEIAWEPRLRPIILEHPLNDVRAVDNQNRQLDSVRDDGTSSVMISQNVSATQLELLLEAPARSATSLKSFKGNVQFLMPSKAEKFTFENLADEKKKEQKIAQATVTLDSVVKNNELWDFHVKLKFEKSYQALDSHLQGWVLTHQPQLIDDKGKVIESAAVESSAQGGSEVGMTFTYDVEKLDGMKWVYTCPVMIQQIKYDYEIKNINLP